MRTAQRNQRTVWYALYVGMTDIVDADGNYTGEQAVTYTEPIQTTMNVSGGRGQAEIEAFGIDNPFTRTLVTSDLTTPFNTDTIFWFDLPPEVTAIGDLMYRDGVPVLFSPKDYNGVLTANGKLFAVADTLPHNYRCTGVAKTVNTCTIAIAEVDKA